MRSIDRVLLKVCNYVIHRISSAEEKVRKALHELIASGYVFKYHLGKHADIDVLVELNETKIRRIIALLAQMKCYTHLSLKKKHRKLQILINMNNGRSISIDIYPQLIINGETLFKNTKMLKRFNNFVCNDSVKLIDPKLNLVALSLSRLFQDLAFTPEDLTTYLLILGKISSIEHFILLVLRVYVYNCNGEIVQKIMNTIIRSFRARRNAYINPILLLRLVCSIKCLHARSKFRIIFRIACTYALYLIKYVASLLRISHESR